MSADTNHMEPTVVAQTAKNLGLAGRFLREALDDPRRLDTVPDGASLILVPYDDPELGVLNLGLASKRAAAGETVRLQRVGVPGPETPQWQETDVFERSASHLRPAWPTGLDDAHLVVGYDDERDALLVDFFADRRPAGAVLPISLYVWLLVDVVADEVVGLLVPHFRELLLRRAPLVGEFLLLSFAEVKDMSRAEAWRRRDEVGYGVHPPSFAVITGELARLIA